MDEDKELIRREYAKHIRNIENSNIREMHCKYKNIGYEKILKVFDKKENLLNVFLGFGNKQGLDIHTLCEILLDFCNSEDDIETQICKYIDSYV